MSACGASEPEATVDNIADACENQAWSGKSGLGVHPTRTQREVKSLEVRPAVANY